VFVYRNREQYRLNSLLLCEEFMILSSASNDGWSCYLLLTVQREGLNFDLTSWRD
jgi:hypothetical protein